MTTSGDFDEDDMERLASRIAMLASDDGEADNAGRAVGTLARRLGLTGGELKSIFLAGLRDRGGQTRVTEEVARLKRENDSLRDTASRADHTARNAQRDRDALKREVTALQATLDQRRSGDQVTRLVGATVAVAILAGGVLLYFGPSFHRPPEPPNVASAPGTPFARTGLVRPAGAPVREQPEANVAILTTLPPGVHVTIKRLFWNALLQWGEVDIGGRPGFIASTDLDLS